ncbi:MAG: DUF2865 domain-containing protein [Proteobacteria bacterium]|nr:DUF2865 domain-containing protein [Pseudomonadota bacterium]
MKGMMTNRLGRIVAFGSATLVAGAFSVGAQQALPPAAGGTNPVCTRLEGQLASVDRGNADPARAEQLRRYEDAASRQQAELDQMVSQSRRLGCEGGGFFSLFTGQAPQCGPLTTRIQQMRANLGRMLADIERLAGRNGDRDGQRQSIVVALAQNNCGPQYRAAVTQQGGGLFDSLFRSGPSATAPGGEGEVQGSGYRTLCVRTCDGFYYPVSFQTSSSRFQEDELACQRTCPGADVTLYTHRNPGEDINQAVSLSGRPYTELPQAFRYRQEFNAACSCKPAGKSWSDALRPLRDTTIERGDIIVGGDKVKPATPPPAIPATAEPKPEAPTAAQPAPGGNGAKRQIRSVGPTFVPVR